MSHLGKPLRFAVYAAGGALVAALLGEMLLAVGQPAPPQQDVMFVLDTTGSMQYAINGTKTGIETFAKQLDARGIDSRVGLVAFRDVVYEPPKVDVMFVLDITGSMQFAIRGVQLGIQDFATELGDRGMDVRVGLVAYRDRVIGEESQVLNFGGNAITGDFTAFKNKVGTLVANGGGDEPESAYDAITLASRQSFRKSPKSDLDKSKGRTGSTATVIILITDASPKVPDKEASGADDVVASLRRAQVDQLHVVTKADLKNAYAPLQDEVPGEYFSLEDAARGAASFDRLLPEVAGQIATTFKDGMAVGGDSSADVEDVPREAEVLTFDGAKFTNDLEAFRSRVATLEAAGGWDDPESSLDALALAARQPFRENATRTLVLVTDAAPHVPDRDMPSVAAARDALLAGKIDQLHLVVMERERGLYSDLWKPDELEGEFFSLARAAGGTEGFEKLLGEVGEKMTLLQGSGGGVAGSAGWLVGLFAVVTGLVAIGIALALVVAQNVSTKRPPLRAAEAGGASIGSFVAGVGASLGGQMLLSGILATGASGTAVEVLGRLLGWTLLGAALGFGMSFVIPNLPRTRSLAGGAIGGLAGALGFLLAGQLTGDVTGRLIGAAALGFFIGLMVALVEVAFRSAWLEVAFGPREKSTVTLGSEPVLVGSGRNCTIWIPGVPEVAYRYRVRDGRVHCEDTEANAEREVPSGDARQAGKVTLTVRTEAGGDTPSGPTMQVRKARPPPPGGASPPQSSTPPPSSPQPSRPTSGPSGGSSGTTPGGNAPPRRSEPIAPPPPPPK